MKREKVAGEQNKYDLIRSILREYASRERPISRKGIEDKEKEMGRGEIGRIVIEGFMYEMKVISYETEEECDEYLKAWRAVLMNVRLSYVKQARRGGGQKDIGCLKAYLTANGCISRIP